MIGLGQITETSTEVTLNGGSGSGNPPKNHLMHSGIGNYRNDLPRLGVVLFGCVLCPFRGLKNFVGPVYANFVTQDVVEGFKKGVLTNMLLELRTLMLWSLHTMTVDNLPLQSGQPGGQENNNQLGGGFKYFYFHPYLEKIPISTNIFQRA